MTTTELGHIKQVDVRQLWRDACGNEYETEFARWLSENLPLLGRPLHLDLERVRLQPPGGWFGLCILAKEVGSDATVAIAGQLSRTNHERLGQLTAYAAANDARIIIWVAPDFHPEHREALELLNRGTPEQIEAYGVEVHAIKIDASPPAHEFRPVVFADAMSKRTRAAMFNLTPAVMNRYDFFQPLVERLWDAGFTNKKVNAHQARAGNEAFASGFHVVTYYAAYHPDDPDTQPSVYLWIAAGSSYKSGRIYDALLAQCRAQFKNEVDVFDPDYWGERGGWRRVSIGVSRPFSDSRSKQGQDAIRDWMFDTLFKFKEVFHDPLEQVTRKLAAEEAEANAAGSKNNNLGDVPAGTADVVAEAGTPAPGESH